MIQAPRALLLDSGGVLMQPIGGRWNPRADFEATVKAHAPQVTDEALAEAFREGDRFMAAATSTPDLDYHHRAMLTRIGVEASPELLAALVCDVAPTTILETFPEGLAPADCLFVDDDPELVAAAVALGYRRVRDAAGRCCRAVGAAERGGGVPVIASLAEVLDLVRGTAAAPAQR